MLSVTFFIVMLSDTMPNDGMLNVILLNVILLMSFRRMLNVVAPFYQHKM
jgi:hypothetical protein